MMIIKHMLTKKMMVIRQKKIKKVIIRKAVITRRKITWKKMISKTMMAFMYCAKFRRSYMPFLVFYDIYCYPFLGHSVQRVFIPLIFKWTLHISHVFHSCRMINPSFLQASLWSLKKSHSPSFHKTKVTTACLYL